MNYQYIYKLHFGFTYKYLQMSTNLLQETTELSRLESLSDKAFGQMS